MKLGNTTVPTWMVAIGATLLAFVLFIVVLFGTVNSYNQKAVRMETALSAQYQANQNELSKFVSSFYETMGIADRKSQQLNTILTDALKGRYEGKTSAQPGQGQLFSAIVEAYPDLSGLNTYDKVVDLVVSGRQSYANKQDKLLDMLRSYNSWRNESLFRKPVLNMMGVPTDSLVARVGNHRSTGEAALEKMHLIVLTSQAQDAYENGTMDPLVPTP